MKHIRMKTTRYIFTQLKLDVHIAMERKLNSSVVNKRDIDDDRKFFSGLLFVPSIAKHF